MTPNTAKSLSDIFETELSVTDKSLTQLQIEATVASIDTLEQQRVFVKNNIIALIAKGTEAIDDMIRIAKSTESGKDYTVVSEMITTLVDNNIQLLDVEVAHKPKLPDASGVDSHHGEITQTNNTVFVGSTAELSKFLKSQNDSSNVIENK